MYINEQKMLHWSGNKSKNGKLCENFFVLWWMKIGIIESFLFAEFFSFYFLMQNLKNNENVLRKSRDDPSRSATGQIKQH
jgi:hypothetical protein